MTGTVFGVLMFGSLYCLMGALGRVDDNAERLAMHRSAYQLVLFLPLLFVVGRIANTFQDTKVSWPPILLQTAGVALISLFLSTWLINLEASRKTNPDTIKLLLKNQ